MVEQDQPRAFLDNLADEIIQNILYYLPIDSLYEVLQASRRLNRIANEPSLWRDYCRADFRYWDEDHEIRGRFTAGVSSTHWKELYLYRRRTDIKTTRLLNDILLRQPDRIKKFQAIAELGYDAKDTLLQHLHVEDNAEDVLARRYFSNAVLGHLHRAMALKEWLHIMAEHHRPLERALMAFDMFLAHRTESDFDYISTQLDLLAERFQQETLIESGCSTRTKALALAQFLRSHNLTGIDSDIQYRDLANNFIGVAIISKTHSSLPLISVAIFCSLAQRLGLDARPCSFPQHVLAIVYPPAGLTLDDAPVLSDQKPQPMYLDPFCSDMETPVEDLRERLARLRVPSVSYPKYLGPATNKEMVMRTACNIVCSVRERKRREPSWDIGAVDRLLPMAYNLDLESASYSATWAMLTLDAFKDEGMYMAGLDATQALLYIIHILETHLPEDVSLIEDNLVPLFEGTLEFRQLIETIRVTRASDAMPKQRHPRGHDVAKSVKYRIGQVFRHRRYDYLAVIHGWDAKCEAAEAWVRRMQVDSLSKGRRQSFYHVTVEDRTTRYVAEENIEIIHPDHPPEKIMPWAGRYFKRWDDGSGSFVSNIRDEYPDD